MSFSEDCARLGDQLARLIDAGVPVREAAGAVGISQQRCYAILRARGRPVGAPRARRGQIDRAQIVAVFTATGSIKAAAKASGISASPARRVLVAEGLVDEARRPHNKVQAKRRFLELVGLGWSARRAAREVGVNERTGRDWRDGIRKGRNTRIHSDGTVIDYTTGSRYTVPVRTTLGNNVACVIGERYLSLQDRLAIADGLLTGQTLTRIGVNIGKHTSTVSREVRAHRVDGFYLPYRAHQAAAGPAPDPSSPNWWSTRTCAKRSRTGCRGDAHPSRSHTVSVRDFPDDESMRVSHETIYQALYFQARGGLKRRSGPSTSVGADPPQTAPFPGQRTHRFVDPMIMISDRPAEVDDRAVPGHWEGDLIMGEANKTAIATLVERATRYTMLVHLPDGHDAEAVRDGLIATIATLPAHLRGSLTWDQGTEMARHKQFSMATDMAVYFCDPASPWQRGTNENTNGLLRQYFPKGTDLSAFGPEDLEHVAQQLNGRPRKTLGWDTPAERLRDLLTT